MWPSESLASRIYDCANWVFFASLVFGVVSTFFLVRMSNVKDTYLKAHLSDMSERVANADARAAEANERAATNEREAQGLRARADEAELELARMTGPPYLVPVIHGVATPDLSAGNKQVVLLTADTRINLPKLPKGKSLAWTLTLTQDAVGQHQFTFSPPITGFGNNLYLPPGSGSLVNLSTDEKGTVNTGLGGTSIPAPNTR